MKNIRNIKILFLITLVVLSCTINSICQAQAQISIPFNVYDNAGGQKTLYFGLDQTATDSIDVNLGESDLPPFPPTGVFDARWILPENNFNGSLSSWRDYRFASGFPFSGTIEHRLSYQSAAGATVMSFSWDFPPEITGLLQDLVNGTLVHVPVNGTGVYELANFIILDQLKLTIYYNNIVTGIVDEGIKPDKYSLEQNYPNPFNPNTTIEFSLPEEAKNVKLIIYNTLGEKITELVNSSLRAGKYYFHWNAEDASSGIYFCELKADKYVSVKKMILLK